MPHITVEFSSNIIERNDMSAFFKACHKVLNETLSTNLINCKSRAIQHNTYYIGDGSELNAFVHISIRILPGRKAETIEATATSLLEIVKNYYARSAKELDLQVTLEITEASQTYYKLQL